MDLSILRGYLQKLVAVNAKSKPMSIDLTLGLIGAYLLQNAVNSISDWSAMKTFIAYLRSECFKGKKKGIISDSSFSDCVLHIQHHVSDMSFEKKKGILMSLGLKVITGVDENGYLTFNNITFPAYASLTIINGKPAQDFIVDSIVDETNNEQVGVDIVIVQDEPIKVQEKETSDTDGILVAEKKQRTLNICTDNSPFIQLYDELVAADPENRSKAKYTWQWLLSLDEYNAIKDCVVINEIPSPKKWDDKTARLLALYIGEFYKREYENNLTPFTQLGENSSNFRFRQYSKLCEVLKIEPYKKENQAHLYTLFVNGGLPAHFISSKLDKDKSNAFIDGLSKLFDAEDGLDIEEGEELLEKINNTALRESYHNHHSIYDYIQVLLKDEKTWNESDNDSAEFCDFKEKIKEASKKANERKKFKLFYSLWTFFDETGLKEFNLLPQLRFNPEEDSERHYAISKQRLEKWGIKNPPAQFSLKMGNTSPLIFTICYNGDYISRGMVDRINLPILDKNLKIKDLSDPDYTIIYDDLRGESCSLKKDFYLPFKDGYMQLYTDDDPLMALWKSYKGAQAFRWSGVLYDKNRYQLLSQNTIIDINDQIGWVTFADSVTFKDTSKGTDRTLYNSKGKIYAYPATLCMHEIIKSPCLVKGCISLDGQAECTIGDEQGKAYIVKSNGIAFDVFRAADDEKVAVSPVVVYKSALGYRDSIVQWQEYDSKKTKLEQGLYVFRLSVGHYMTEVDCYVLPEEAHISFYNTSEPYKIEFNKITDVTSMERIVNSPKDESIVFRISNNSNSNDKYTFTLGDDVGHITLRTYHPKAQTHLYLHGQEITDKPIIMAYAEDIEINYISAKICMECRLSDIDGAYKHLFNALTVTTTDNNNDGSLLKGFDIKLHEDDRQSSIKIRVYTQDFQNNNDNSCNLMLLDLNNNELVQYTSNNVNNIIHDNLLLQSLKQDCYTGVYYAPNYIPQSGQKVARNVKVQERTKRLYDYAKCNMYVSDYAYQQFEIACKHKIYFAVFDALLCICWDGKKQVYLDRDKKKFKDNVLTFLKGYVAYTTKNSKEPYVIGLRRLAKEFLFDWTIIKKDIENSDSQQLKELYQEIINN